MVEPEKNRTGEVSAAKVIATDRFNVMQAELAARSRQQSAVAELGQAALTRVDSSLLIGQACGLILDTLGVDFCRVLEYVPDQEGLVPRAFIGHGIDAHPPDIDDEAMYTFAASEPVVFSDLGQETRFSGAPLLSRLGVTSGVSVTLPGASGPLGVLGVYTKSAREFREYETEFVQSISNVLAAAIESKRTREALDETRAQVSRRERLASIASWTWSRGKRDWQWSEGVYEILGLRPGDMAPDYLSFISRVHGEDRVAFAALVEKALSEPGEHSLQHRVVRSDGQSCVVRSFVEGIFGHGGKPLRLIGMTQDVTTAEHAVQQEVRLSALIELAAQEWRMTCDAVDAVIVVADSKGTMLRINERARHMLHLSFDDAIGRPLPSTTLGEPWATIRQLATVVAETDVPTTATAQDERRSWEITARGLTGADQEDERIVVVAYDMTARARREQIRHETDLIDAATTLIGGVAQRAAAPVTKLSNLLASDYGRIALASEPLRQARSAIYELASLLEELDEYSKPFVLDREPRSPRPILDDAIAAVSSACHRRNITIVREYNTQAQILLNEPRLRVLFDDLLGTFLDRVDAGTRIEISLSETTWRRHPFVLLVIEGAGPIFTKTELEWMLDCVLPDVRTDRGIRFSIDHRIVDEHGGTALLANRVREGVSFASLRFPMYRLSKP